MDLGNSGSASLHRRGARRVTLVATYRFAAHDLRSNTFLGDVPLVGTFTERLSRAGTLVGSLNLTDERAQAFLDATTPRRTVLWIDRDGATIDAHIIWARQTMSPTPTLMLRGASIWSYFARRRLIVTKGYAAWDQLAIAKDLLDWAQAQPGGNIGLTVEANTSGRLRNRHPLAWDYEAKEIGTLVEQLAAVIDGFDFSIDAARDASGIPFATFRTHYPRRGRRVDVSGTTFTFTLNGNLLDIDVHEDEESRPNTVLAIGAGGGTSQIETPARDTSEIDAGYPLLEATYVRKDISEADTLYDNAQGDLVRRQDSTLMTLRVDPDHEVSPLGSYVVGDDARIMIAAGEHPRFPRGLDTVMRILERKITVRDTGADDVYLTMGAARG